MGEHCANVRRLGNALSLKGGRGIIQGMTPAQRQTEIATELLQLDDPHERLSYVQDRVRRRAPFPDAKRREECRIQGCATRVWLAPSLESGRCIFEVDSESAMVRGLAALVADVYSGATPQEVLRFRCTILSEARLLGRITPTRQHGLSQLESAIHAHASAYAPESRE